MRVGDGGGVEEEHEHIEVLEIRISAALEMVRNGEIRDVKTIMLLQHLQLEDRLAAPKKRSLHVLVAGSYRSGTGDDPVRIERNLDLMNKVAYAVYERGHLPVLGEWYALPLLKEAARRRSGVQRSGGSFIRPRFGYWSIAMRRCGSAALRRARTRWFASG